MSELIYDDSTRAQFENFISLLTFGHSLRQVCYQSLEDSSADGARVKGIKFELPQLVCYDALVDLNQKGYFTNACLNVFQPAKKSAKNVSGVRGYAVDIDSYTPIHILSAAVEYFTPTMVVLSSSVFDQESNQWLSKAHFYWLYDYAKIPFDSFGDDQEALKTFKDVQIWLALLVRNFLKDQGIEEPKVDLQLNSLSLALRIPGLYHQKNKESVSLTTLWHYNVEAYLTQAVVVDEAGKLLLKDYKKEEKAKNAVLTGEAGNAGLGAFPNTDPSAESVYLEVHAGGRNSALYGFVFNRLLCEKKLAKDEATGAAWAINLLKNKPPLPDEDVTTIVNSAWNHYLERLQLAENAEPVDAPTARSLLISEAAAGNVELNELRDNGIEVDDHLNPALKKKLTGTRTSTTTSGAKQKATKLGRGRPKKSSSMTSGTEDDSLP